MVRSNREIPRGGGMSETEITQETHRKLAVDRFHRVWALLETSNRTTEETDERVHAGHASRYHCGEIETHSSSSAGSGRSRGPIRR